MALSLSAEQKNIDKLFSTSETYVIPNYQRPYSWEYDQCSQLYNDIIDAYAEQKDYFIGNIILAKANQNRGELRIVDGQQRLISTWLMMRVLMLLFPTMRVLKDRTEIAAREEGVSSKPSIVSYVFEGEDSSDIQHIYELSEEAELEHLYKSHSNRKGQVVESKCSSKIISNALWFYLWIKLFRDEDEIRCKELINFLLDHVYMLPIELTEETMEQADNKALTIFETINNRGMNLEDADIFKAKLYDRAMAAGKRDDFISSWISFRSDAESIGLSVDDVFRFYSHIVRGREGITTSLINLREFFIKESFSPLRNKDYQQVIDDLNLIVGIVAKINNWKAGKVDSDEEIETAKWIQIMYNYSNQYPSFAIVTYMFVNGSPLDYDQFTLFLKRLARYSYLMGTTTTVKFEIFNIIKRISHKEQDLIPDSVFKYFVYVDYPVKLRKGFALMARYLSDGDLLGECILDKLITPSDFRDNYLNDSFPLHYLMDVYNSLGNDVLSDLRKKYLPLKERLSYYQTSVLFKDVIDVKDVVSYIEKKTNDRELVLTRFLLPYEEN
jgi:uncharacterized protein with ParB-like and HNH nuclease domain